MTVTESGAARFDNERVMGLLIYGLLFSAVFFAGVPGIVAVVLAYVQQGSASPFMRGHYRFQIQIFWIGVLLGLIAGICGLWAVVDVVRSGDWTGEVQFEDLAFTGRVIGLFIACGAFLAIMTLWSLAAPAVGFLRLATAARPAEAAR